MKRTTKVKNGLLALIIITVLIAIIGGTYARYSSQGTANATTSFAKWSINLNGQDISSQQKNVDITLTVDDDNNPNIASGKIAPGRTLSGTFEVDPTGSEVAVDYILTVGTVEAPEWNSGSKLSLTKISYRLGDSGEFTDLTVTDSKAKLSESLSDVLAGKKATFKFTVAWDNDNNNNNAADTENGNKVTSVKVPVNIIARQHLTGDVATVEPVSTSNGIVDAVAGLSAGETLNVTESLDYRNDYTKNQRLQVTFPDYATFDLGGNEITTMNGGLVYTGKNLTIQNGTFTGLNDNEGRGRAYGLCLYDFNEGSSGNKVLVKNVVLNGGTTIYNEDVTLDSCTVTAANYYAVYGNQDTSITINSGTYTATEGTLALLGISTTNNTREDFVINGGTFITNGKPLHLASGLMPTIRGGSFDVDVTSYIDQSAYKCTQNTTGYYVVTPL